MASGDGMAEHEEAAEGGTGQAAGTDAAAGDSTVGTGSFLAIGCTAVTLIGMVIGIAWFIMR